MDTPILEVILAYLINLASNERSSAISAARETNLNKLLNDKKALHKALTSIRSIEDDVRSACVTLVRHRTLLGVSRAEEPLWQLLQEEVFQADIIEWLKAGAIEEGKAAETRLRSAMIKAASHGGGTAEQAAFLESHYFQSLEKTLFANPVLAQWRHNLSLEYLREQVAKLRNFAEEAAGIFTVEKQNAALARYCEKALAAWDIIDLSNLPEGDIHMATQKLLLRQLYMPLRIEVESSRQGERDDVLLARIERKRDARRHREAGHLSSQEFEVVTASSQRASVGERLTDSGRLIILGDPGGGKTTMLRWMATAFLLRYMGDEAFSQVPDTATLPIHPWIPVLIRCRDLGDAELCRCFADFLSQHLQKTELLPEEADVMTAVFLDLFAKGKALLLVDGLDEITDPRVRVMFCQELERTAVRYPHTSIVVTSRIVGYRDMPFRMGAGFEHGQIAELVADDKDRFAQQWVAITEQYQSPTEQKSKVKELLEALHSSERIERLTGNPMLLTTLALVKRKVGKLPNKRSKLYAEAVAVLLNWNPKLYRTIEEDEALPQLEYLAYEMCRRGVQRLTEDAVLDLLDQLRSEYPNVRAVKRHDGKSFLDLLEARSSILIKSGGIWHQHDQREKAVWEFRHLTFQEYLAARALLDGRYPNRSKSKTLAEHVAPLASVTTSMVRDGQSRSESLEVPESWREALRLLVSDCKDDDVDEVVNAILDPMPGEDQSTSARPRAVLATLCLADEPNVTESCAQNILSRFATLVDKNEHTSSSDSLFERAAIEVGCSMWLPFLKTSLIDEFCRRPCNERAFVGILWAKVELSSWRRSGTDSVSFFSKLVQRLRSQSKNEAISAALTLMLAAFQGELFNIDDAPRVLLNNLSTKDTALQHAFTWALGWLARGSPTKSGATPQWHVSANDATLLADVLDQADNAEHSTRRWLAVILGIAKHPHIIDSLARRLEDSDSDARRAVVDALGALGDKRATDSFLKDLNSNEIEIRRRAVMRLGELNDTRAVEPLLAMLDDTDEMIRRSVVSSLVQLKDSRVNQPLLTKLTERKDISVCVLIISLLARSKNIIPSDLLLELSKVRNIAVSTHASAALHFYGNQNGTVVLRQRWTSGQIKCRIVAVQALASYRDQIDQLLMSRDLDAREPWMDSKELSSARRVRMCAGRLGISSTEVRNRLRSITTELGL